MAVHFPLLLCLLLFPAALPTSCAIGINYGQVANNLLSPSDVIPLLRSIGVTRVKLYDSDPAVLQAFANTGIDFVLGIPDRCIAEIARNTTEAIIWVKANVVPYLSDTNISAVTVGNEVLTTKDPATIRYLIPAMQAVHSALVSLNLDHPIAVTTPHSLAVLATSYPPSSATFRKDITPYVSRMLTFLAKTGSPFLINAYPYFAYKADPTGIKLDYALSNPDYPGVVDSKTGLTYDNMLYAQVDAVYTAMEAVMGMEKAKEVEVRVSETGWPSKGDADEAGATVENARRYNGNLIRLVEKKQGTPKRPDSPLETYIFALFNENMKPGPASERNYGLFKPDGTPVYQLGTMKPSANSTSHNGGGSGGDGNLTSPVVSMGYDNITSATKGVGLTRFGALLCLLPAMLGVFIGDW